MINNIFLNSAVIVVFYNPTKDQIKNFCKLSEIIKVIVVDNSKHELDSGLLGQCIYLPFHNNYGIATAQNKGIEKSREIGAKYIIFFDQDSEVNGSLLEALIQTFEKKRKEDPKTAAIGPLILDSRTNIPYKRHRIEESSGEITECSSLISTGTITSLEVLNDVGCMEDALFIDCVDFEWCWRATHYGYRLYKSNIIKLLHTVGNADSSFCGFPIIVSSPSRYYYKYRNTLLLLRRSYVPNNWKVKNIIRLSFNLFLFLFGSPYKGIRKDCLKNAFKGIRSGMVGVK